MKKTFILVSVMIMCLSVMLVACSVAEPIKLATPTVEISDAGVASWDVSDAAEYSYKINGGEAQSTEQNSVQLQDGDSIEVQAIGDGKNFYNSNWSETVTFKKPTKLATPTVEIADDGTASWEVSDAVEYSYKINGGEAQSTEQNSVQLQDGDSIEVQAIGDGKNFADSDWCEAVTAELIARYTREIYLLPNESYDYMQQRAYEGLSTESLQITFDGKSYTAEFSCNSFSYANGMFTASATVPDDMTDNIVTISEEQREETVHIKVINQQKYGSTLAAPDVGRLYGKNVLFFGDSITDQSAIWWKTNTWYNVDTDGKYIKVDGSRQTIKGITQNYVNMLNDACKFSSCTNTAIAGALVSYYNAAYGNKSISITQMVKTHTADIEKAQYVFIMGGTNDSYEINKSGSVLKLGEVSDVASEEAVGSTVAGQPLSTFCGFYNYVIQTIQKVNPNAIIICLSNIPCESTYGYYGGVSNGHNNEGISEVNTAISQIAKANLVRYVDIYSAIPTESDGKTYTIRWFTNDLLHPNETAYKLVTAKILADSQSLLTKTAK